jgi:hypothetical protein
MNTPNFYPTLKKMGIFLLFSPFFNLMAQEVKPFDILINEFMPDPSPVVGLPNAEYIELYNRSEKDVNLKGYKLFNGSVSTELHSFILKSKHFVTIHAEKKDTFFGKLGDTIRVPKLISLSNPGDTFYLKSPENNIVDAVFFDLSFYQNSKKSDGGWSLERINPNDFCSFKNWVASNDLKGGTPSKINSVLKIDTFKFLPEVLGFYLKNENTIVVKFDKMMNRDSLLKPSNYSIENTSIIDNTLKINKLKPIEPFFDGIEISFNTPFKKGEIYNLVLKTTLNDCQNTPFPKNEVLVLKLPEIPQKNDVIINEILANPETGGSRFIELFNRSEKVVDVSKLKIAEFNQGKVKDMKPVTANYLLFPKQYVVFTDNPSYIQKRYKVEHLKKSILKTRLPTWNDKEGTVGVYTFNENKEVILDSFTYTKKFYNPLLANTEGVSLERIAIENLINSINNWQSAALSVAYGTPAYQNSHYFSLVDIVKNKSVSSLENDVLTIETPVFSPDGDAFQDTFLMRYKMAKEGFVANWFIFDSNGRLVKKLKINELLALEGQVKWEGDTDEGLPALSGTYIFYAELKHPTGESKKWKKAFVLTYRY